MHLVEIRTNVKKLSDGEKQFDIFDHMLSAQRWNGQILGREIFIIRRPKVLASHVLIPELDALDSKNNSSWVDEIIGEFKQIGLGLPKVQLLGEGEDTACNCKKPNEYVLFAHYTYMGSPLRCLTCFGGVPLYRIPPTEGGEYVDIIRWAGNYTSCHRLYMNDVVGERFAINQMSDLSSSLTQTGLDTCKRIQKLTGRRTYYFLRKFRGKNMASEMARRCPSCDSEWKLKKRLHYFDFKCSRCNLVSQTALGIL
jgi:predicted  nucleic acid-binding Zn ribbon protein